MLAKASPLVKVKRLGYNIFEMSKKDKSKFRKRIREQLLKEMAQLESQPVKKTIATATTATPVFPKSPQSMPTADTAAKPIASSSQEPATPINYLNFIKRDLKKSAIIIGSIISIIIILTVVDNRTNILIKTGNQIFQVLHIGT